MCVAARVSWLIFACTAAGSASLAHRSPGSSDPLLQLHLPLQVCHPAVTRAFLSPLSLLEDPSSSPCNFPLSWFTPRFGKSTSSDTCLRQGAWERNFCHSVFSFAAITDCHKFSILRQHPFIISQVWRLEVQNQGVGRAAS